MTKRTKIITALSIGAVLAFAIISIKNKKEAIREIPVMKSYAVVVSNLQIKKAPVKLTLPYFATVMSDQTTTLASRLSARIESISKSGTPVKKGDTVAVLDTRDIKDKQREVQLQIASTKAAIYAKESALQTAKAAHIRTKALMRVKAAPKERFDSELSKIKGITAERSALENKIKILTLTLSELNTSLSYAQIKAGYKGIISKTYVNAGDMAMPGKPLLEIQGEEGKYLLLRMADASDTAEVILDGKTYALTSLHRTFNGLHEYRADVKTDRSSGERVTLSLVTYNDVGIRIPLGALLQKEGRDYCFVIKGARGEAREVEILARGENGVVVGGLKEGERIVVAKPDLLLQILGGRPLSTQKEKRQ